MIKIKAIIRPAAVAAAVFTVLAAGAAASDFPVFYNEGVERIQETEYRDGRRQLMRIIEAGNAPVELRFKAALWSAHSYLEEDRRRDAAEVLDKIFDIEGHEKSEEEVLEELDELRGAVRLYTRQKRARERDRESRIRNLERNLRRAKDLMEAGRIREASEIAQSALEIDPESEEAKEIISKTESLTREIEEKIPGIESLIEAGDFTEARLGINDLLELASDHERLNELDEKVKAEEVKALRMYEEVERKLDRAFEFFSERRYDRAEEELNAVLEYAEDERIAAHVQRLREEKQERAGKPELEENPAELLETAADEIEEYEMSSALQKLERLLGSSGVPGFIRYQAYFMRGFVYDFNDEKDSAKENFLELVRSGLHLEYNITELPESLAQNYPLIEIYNQARRRHEREREIKYYESIASLIEEAGNLADEIQFIREIRIETQRDFIDYVYERSRYAYKSGDYANAARKADQVLRLNPSNHLAKYIYDSSMERLSSILGHAGRRENDILRQAVERYVAGNFTAAARRFRRIRDTAPAELDILIAQCEIQHTLENSRRRSARLLREADTALRRHYYDEALEKAMVALSLDDYNLDAAVLIEELRYLRSRE